MNVKDEFGHWACVAGAAEGLGYAFAEALARRGMNLILIDKDKNHLGVAVEKLRKKHQISIESLAIDLAKPYAEVEIMAFIRAYECRFLVYNAAHGPVRPFLSNSREELDLYLRTNMSTVLHLVHQFVEINQSKPAGLLLLSSLAGFRGTQFVIPYAATKAFTWNLAEGLYYEFRNTPFRVSVCCPGTIDTPNFRSTNPKKSLFTPKPMPPEKVAEEAMRKFGHKLFIIPGTTNRVAHFLLNRLLPRRIASKIHNRAMKKMYGF